MPQKSAYVSRHAESFYSWRFFYVAFRLVLLFAHRRSNPVIAWCRCTAFFFRSAFIEQLNKAKEWWKCRNGIRKSDSMTLPQNSNMEVMWRRRSREESSGRRKHPARWRPLADRKQKESSMNSILELKGDWFGKFYDPRIQEFKFFKRPRKKCLLEYMNPQEFLYGNVL